MPQAVALRDKDMGIWREWTWATYWEHIELAGHALLALGVEPGDRVAIHSENRPEWLIADMGALAVRAASVGIYPTNPAAEVGYLLGDSGAKVLVAEDQEQVDKAFAVLDECPDLERIVYLEPRGIRHRYDHEKLMSWQDVPRPGPRAPRAASRRAGGRARRPAPGRPGHADLHVGHDRAAEGRDADAWPTSSSRSGSWSRRAPSPTRRPARATCSLSYLPLSHVAERIFTTWFNAAAGTQVNFAESIETVPPEPARGAADHPLRGPPDLGEAAGRRSRSASPAPPGSSARSRRSGSVSPTGSGHAWSRTAARTPSARGCVYALGYVVFFRALKDRLGHAQGPVRRVGCGADRARGAAVLHGHRGADARGLRDDREHRGRHRQPARPGQARHGGRGAPGHRAPDRRGDRRDPDPARRRVRGLLAQGRGHRGRR